MQTREMIDFRHAKFYFQKNSNEKEKKMIDELKSTLEELQEKLEQLKGYL
jgi:hypothetical protein